MYAGSAESFEATFDMGVTGLVGTIEVRIEDGQGNIVQAASAAAIVEAGVSGIYTATRTAPGPLGQYLLIASTDGSFDEGTVAEEDLVVISSTATGTLPPITPPSSDGGLTWGPCSSWIAGEDVADVCTGAAATVGSDFTLLDPYAASASTALWAASGRLFSGACEQTVRPCVTVNCGFQVLSRGHVIDPWSELGLWNPAGWWWWNGTRPCGCMPLSRVLLSGYPVREIVQVKIDGAVVDPLTYRLDEHRYLTRVIDPADPDTALVWPGCQLLDRDDTNQGTWSVTYTYGQDPPQLGTQAAAQLACEIWKQANGQQCSLPAGTTRVTREGITIERTIFAYDRALRTWRTGLTLVDLFLNMVNPNGLQRRPAVYSPDSQPRYARPVG